MVEVATKLPIKTETKDNTPAPKAHEWHPFATLRREIDQLLKDFGAGAWHFPSRRALFAAEPFWRRDLSFFGATPVDIAERDQAYEITAELPGLDEKNIDVQFAGGVLTIKGEKRDERGEKNKEHYICERHYGSFRRAFQVPDGIDAEKIEASLKNGVLTVTLPKSPQAQKQEKKIAVTAK